ncbi:MAG: lactate utilization protein [Alphaproteobacteria bacterium]|jgi:L-lactate dehydrogenase complex protein LldG|nr:lactate utilization protein [Alphaproteobacteria bacterium]MDP6517695.1 lactate utilization protein [Alphaproteobacteria bacterium]
MTGARSAILSEIRRRLGRGPLDDAARARLDALRPAPAPVDVPGDHDQRVAMLAAKAEAVNASVARIESMADLPGAVADYLASQNLPPQAVVTPDEALSAAPWAERPLLTLRRGTPGIDDQVALTCAFAGIAETGSLLVLGDRDNPHSASFVPETNIAVLPAGRVVATLEDALARLRDHAPVLPRAACFITGPSRTGDIAQRIELGAHGPRRLHVVIVDGEAA